MRRFLKISINIKFKFRVNIRTRTMPDIMELDKLSDVLLFI